MKFQLYKFLSWGVGKVLYTFALTLIFLLPTISARADGGDPIPYAVVENDTVKFYCDNNKPSENAFDLQEEYTMYSAPWKNVHVVVFDQSFKKYNPTSCANWFSGFPNQFIGFENLNTESVTDMSYMFANRFGFIPYLDLSTFNTNKVTNMEGMFTYCNIATIFVGEGWSTKSVTNSKDMFKYCYYLGGGKGTQSNENHTDASYAHIDGGETNPGYLSSYSAQAEASPYAMQVQSSLYFFYDNKKTENPNYYSFSHEKLDEQTVADAHNNGWHGMYGGIIAEIEPQAWSYNTMISNVVIDKSFKDYRPTSTNSWFLGLYYLSSIEGLENLNTEDVTDMSFMFFFRNQEEPHLFGNNNPNAPKSPLQSLDLSSFNTSKVTKMTDMFFDCSSLHEIYVGDGWNTDNVEDDDIYGVFSGCPYLYGGKGTLYDVANSSKEYARIDDPEHGKPGYFTRVGEDPWIPSSLTITTMPTKTVYEIGEYLDLQGGEVLATFPNGTTRSDALTNCFPSNTYFSQSGKQTITVTYIGKSVTFDVTVKEKSPGEPSLVNGVYQITSAANLLWFANYVNSGNTNAKAELIDDIVLNENLLDKIDKGETENLVTWIPIGTADNPYKGIFTTDTFAISGLYVNDSKQNYVGLFGYYAPENIQYVYYINVKDSYFAGHDFVGGLFGYVNSEKARLSDFYFRGEVSGNSNVGGLFGKIDVFESLSSGYVSAKVTGSSNVGSVCGYLDGKTENNSFDYLYYDTQLCSLGAINGTDDVENNIIGKNTFHTGEVANLLWLRQDLSDPSSFPEFKGQFVHKNLSGSGYHNPEYEDHHCKYCINYTYSLPQLVDGVYQISTADELYGFMHIVNTDNPSANAVLTADIVVNEKVLEKVYSGNTEGLREWYSIGNDDGYRYGYYDTFCPFVGVFDGNFHIISGLYFDNFDNQLSWVQFGLFGTIYNTVKNVILNDTYFKTSGNTGGIVGYISDGNGSFGKSALIENCIFDGEIISEGMGAGICKSIVSSSNIKNCINFGTLTGSSYSGGIVGADWSGGCGNIENCYNVGKIVCKEPAGEFTSVGGICGGANIGNISNCYNTGSISSGYGVYGWNWSYRPLTNIYNNSDICNLPISYYHYTGGNLTTAQLCNGTLPEGFSSDDWIPGKTVTADDGTITYTFPHLKVFDGKYPAHIITKPGVKAIAIKTPPTQTEYALGDDLSKVGLVVTFTYSDHTTIDVDYYGSYDQTSTEYQLKNSLMDSDFDFDNTSTGKKTVTVRYQDLSAQFEVNVVDRGVCGYQYLDEDGTLTFYYGKYRTGAGYIGANGCSKPFNADDVKKAVFDPSFKDFKPTNLTSMLGFYPNLQEIVDMDKYLNTEEVTSMAFMFAGYQLTTLDLSTFDTRKVENMSYMFNDFGSNKSKLQTIYVGDKWSTDNVKGSTAMFGNCPDLVGGKGTKNADLPHNWTDEVSYACVDDPEHGKPGLFTYKASTPVDPREPYALLTDNGETVTFYYDANKSQHQDALGFDGDYWNFGWQSAKVAIFDESFKEYKPTSCAFWFYNCTQLTEISHLDYLNTEDVTEMQWMFMGCENLESIDVSKFNTSKVTNMPMMFCNCHKITELDLSSFDNSQFANNGLVMSCHNLTTIYVEDKWINHRVGFYFSDCPKLIGGQGTLYNVNNRIDGSDALYARIDGGESAPGYFTRKGTTKPEVKSIAITTLPKTAYVLGEELNTDNGELAVTIGNRNPQPHDFQGATVTGYDKTKEGKQTLTVEFLGATTTYDIEIAPLTPIDTIFTAPTKLSYIEGEDLDLTGGYFTIKFNNLETEKITLTNENATISGFDNAKIGEQTISVDYFPNTFTFTVNVEAKTAIAIEITQLPTKLEYLEGEEFVPDGGELIVTYNNKTSETLELAKATITGFDSNTIGEQTVTVDYLGQKAEFKAKVKRKNPYEAPVVIDDVYQITKAQDLFWFVIEVNNGNTGLNAALTNDIVINQDLWKQINKTTKAEPQLTVWKPIGTEHSAFSGTFDGQGHTISGIYINDETQSNVGLFGVTTETAVIKNLGVTDSYISGNENVGAICGKSEGTVVNCYTVSEVVGNKNVNPLVGAKEKAAVVQNSFYLADSPKANDPCAKTAEQFKSGEVAAQLAKGATINGVTYSGESFAGLTELPGTENIEVISDPENPPTPVSEISPNINVNVWSYNHIIYIDNAPDAEYRIIDLNGRLITTSTTKSTKEEIQINKSGILIVIIGNQSFKVSL